jgi:hypothetical protein
MKTTKEAFEELVSRRNWWKNVLPNSNNASVYKRRLKAGILTESTMEKLLKKAGYESNEKIWLKKNKSAK